MSRRRRFQPDEIAVAWQAFSFTGEDGTPITVPTGGELRGDHEAVRRHPELFVPHGTPRNEWPSPLDKSFATAVERRNAERAERERRSPTIPRTEQVRATETFSVVVAGEGRHVRRGQHFHRNDPVVRAAPGYFETLPQPLPAA